MSAPQPSRSSGQTPERQPRWSTIRPLLKRRQRPPGPTGHLVLGSVPEFAPDPARFMRNLHREYGDVAHFRLGMDHCYLLGHPDHVRHVLRTRSTSYRRALFFEKATCLLGDGLLSWPFEDAHWRKRRRISQPVLRPGCLPAYFDLWVQGAEELFDRWDALAAAGEEFDAFREMMLHSEALAASSLLGIAPGSSQRATIAAAFTTCLDHIMHKVESIVDLPEWIPTAENRRFVGARGALDELIQELIAERRACPVRGAKDLVGRLLEAEEREPYSADDAQLRDDLMTLFVAGFETNAAALAFALLLLAQNPDFERDVVAELHSVLDGRRPTFDDMPKLSRTRMLIQETMRLYPPGWWIPRAALEEDVVSGYTIPAGATVIVSPLVTHRHPDFWNEPDRFDPYRFEADAAPERHPLAYFPYGDGPRGCPGANFSMLLLQLVITQLLLRYELSSSHQGEVGYLAGVTARPRGGVPLTIRRRDAARAATATTRSTA